MEKLIHLLHPVRHENRFMKVARVVRPMYGIRLPRWDIILSVYKSTHYMSW